MCGGNFFILAISDVLSQIRQPNGGGGGEMFLHKVLSVLLDLSDRREEKTGKTTKGAERMN